MLTYKKKNYRRKTRKYRGGTDVKKKSRTFFTKKPRYEKHTRVLFDVKSGTHYRRKKRLRRDTYFEKLVNELRRAIRNQSYVKSYIDKKNKTNRKNEDTLLYKILGNSLSSLGQTSTNFNTPVKSIERNLMSANNDYDDYENYDDDDHENYDDDNNDEVLEIKNLEENNKYKITEADRKLFENERQYVTQ